jgi:hypothetical protein
MKTAMQELYDLLDDGCIGQVLKDKSEFLEMERNQIIDAFNVNVFDPFDVETGEQYFKRNYDSR